MTPLTVQLPTPQFIDGAHQWMRQSWADTHRFKVNVWHRRARKTTFGLNRLIVESAFTHNESYAYIGPTYKQAKATVLHDPLMLSRWLPPDALRGSFNKSELWGEFHSGSKLFIKGADDPDSLRGIRLKGVVLDEFAKMKPATFYETLYPTLMDTHGWAILNFTPKGKNHGWDAWRKAGNPEFPDWSRLMLKASVSGLLTDEQLLQARHEMGDDLYEQEMECAFLESASSVFKGLESCLVGHFEPPLLGRRYVMGVDLGRMHDATVLTILDAATRHLVAYQRLTENHWALQKSSIAALSAQYQAPLILIDATGFSAGDPISEDLREMGLSVEGFKYSDTSKRALIDGLRIALAQRLITIPREATQLIEELQDFEMTMDDLGRVHYSAPSGDGFFDDSVNSLALAVHALKSDLYVPRQSVYEAVEYEAALDALPVNGGMSFRGP